MIVFARGLIKIHVYKLLKLYNDVHTVGSSKLLLSGISWKKDIYFAE